MSHATEQAEELRRRAIEILLVERTAIDERLAMLTYDAAILPNPPSGKRRACGICGSGDHNARRCPKNGSEGTPTDPNL